MIDVGRDHRPRWRTKEDDARSRRADISIDGGVKVDNARQLAQRGASILVAGSAVFEAPDPGKVVRELKHLADGT